MKIKNNKNKKGFTLIELIVVIAILAILAAVAVPNFIGITDKAQTATEIAAAAEYANAINITSTITQVKPTDVAVGKIEAVGDLISDDLLPSTPNITEDDIPKLVLARIKIAGGIASVANRDDIK